MWAFPHQTRSKLGNYVMISTNVRIQVVVLKTYRGRWTIGRSGERGSGISVLPARYDDDDEEHFNILCFLNFFPDFYLKITYTFFSITNWLFFKIFIVLFFVFYSSIQFFLLIFPSVSFILLLLNYFLSSHSHFFLFYQKDYSW